MGRSVTGDGDLQSGNERPAVPGHVPRGGRASFRASPRMSSASWAGSGAPAGRRGWPGAAARSCATAGSPWSAAAARRRRLRRLRGWPGCWACRTAASTDWSRCPPARARRCRGRRRRVARHRAALEALADLHRGETVLVVDDGQVLDRRWRRCVRREPGTAPGALSPYRLVTLQVDGDGWRLARPARPGRTRPQPMTVAAARRPSRRPRARRRRRAASRRPRRRTCRGARAAWAGQTAAPHRLAQRVVVLVLDPGGPVLERTDVQPRPVDRRLQVGALEAERRQHLHQRGGDAVGARAADGQAGAVPVPGGRRRHVGGQPGAGGEGVQPRAG